MIRKNWLLFMITALLCMVMWGCAAKDQVEPTEDSSIIETEAPTEEPGPTDDWGIGEF